jgi:ubiquinone/menaquinone biosynthesis C-methylase UbiE
MDSAKKLVHDFWEDAACGEALYLSDGDYLSQAQKRYELEPYIAAFADFEGSAGKNVLEIGVGLGADHEQFARGGAKLTGIDLTARAIEHTRARFQRFGLSSHLSLGDAENLPFAHSAFDMVYSWGVLHHSPDTQRAVDEIWRVLKPGGVARVMIYHRYSIIGFMLWLRYGLLRLRSLDHIYSEHLESPGTKAYSRAQANRMFGRFSVVNTRTVLTHGDLLTSNAGQRHRGLALALAKRIWPRALIRALMPRNGLFMLVSATK